ncbi:TetR/AcrR family transcriptional regulator [Pseudomonas aeruginosa]|uniref:TetR/AcrR family transcriptional regulator n=1 Tax=Pseudomonas aeruginosa TaxID=287 RepID=UPI0005EA11EB|nr:TetR/AcrR family transcriptional regulator [Pseudomonas aeruginosa]HCL2760558.1 TetR/AcrR family transcriptional regulator [Pseudomonas aeruginosa 449A]KJJ15208.1 transcriptional regulator, TetR family [Pseudomonas aeruginosa]MCQ9839143.1 TetR/AcrR family transcriptional regulator [Pseudomonas aeruginosa]MCW5542861.1 TetR/AcrR family transcriptional regulator [Pseudomonas aeruginosa]MCW5563216.1 TetR/AcrR family transcriptional regulator [Pseudomonas aeruginosa]
MPKKSNAAERIVHATASLLASRGYFGTGLSDIIARAEAPKGSLYHYFPEGKPQIASAAIGFVADEVASFLDRAGTQAPPCAQRPPPVHRDPAWLAGAFAFRRGLPGAFHQPEHRRRAGPGAR